MKSFAVLFLAVAFMAPNVWAESKEKGSRGEGRGGFGKILKQLELTDDQKEALKASRKAHKAENKDSKTNSREELKGLRNELKAKFASDASESELRSLHTKIKTLRSAKAEKRFGKMMNIRKILTVEQRKKFQELQGQRKGSKRKQ